MFCSLRMALLELNYSIIVVGDTERLDRLSFVPATQGNIAVFVYTSLGPLDMTKASVPYDESEVNRDELKLVKSL